jgi:outer membrane protein OmpA-like peptidoglycan-associated protein
MMLDRRGLLLGLAAVALAGCDGAALDRIAGSDINEGSFATASANNLALMRGQIDVAAVMQQRFASEVATTVNFDFDSAALDDEARAIVSRQAHWILQFPEIRFSVYGHTDLVGSERYNHALGLRRARAVVDALAANGVDRRRLQALVSRGPREPVVPTQGPERQNRRAVTRVAGFMRRHPTVMNGQYAQIIQREFVESATFQRPIDYQIGDKFLRPGQ